MLWRAQTVNMQPLAVRCSCVTAFAVAMAIGTASTASACGYDNPQAFALGTLNWAYPNALYVRTAVWQAEDAGLLPPRGQPTAPGPFAFLRAASLMKQFGARLSEAKLSETGAAIAVVLIPQVMWTRFETDSDDLDVKVHATGPVGGDVVVVTNDKVVRALVNGSLDAATAEARGLLRFYGGQEQIPNIRTVIARVARPHSAVSETVGRGSLHPDERGAD